MQLLYTAEQDPIPREIRHILLPQEIVLRHGHIEAWGNIIKSYHHAHPDHKVIIKYEGVQVNSLLSLFKRTPHINPRGFVLEVEAEDREWEDVGKLHRLLVEGASDNYTLYIGQEIHQTLRLF